MSPAPLQRQAQGAAPFTAGDPASGYYNDMTVVALDYGSPRDARAWFDLMVARREHALPVSLLQLGLGAWQLRGEDPAWGELALAAAEWCAIDLDGHGLLRYHQPMHHTYDLPAPWGSCMAQGQALSLLVRAALTMDRPDLFADAVRALGPLVARGSGLVDQSELGPVLQEYPTDPPANVLNGWIFGLFGLADLAAAEGAPGDARATAREAFESGCDALAARLPLYDTGRGWSRYDLYPHPVEHVASPFYHRLHIALLRALDEVAPHAPYGEFADRWERSLGRPTVYAGAVARKVGFRLLRPRRKAA
jgi:hypothetical protein